MPVNAFTEAEVQLHRAAQMISLTGINFVQHVPDDSHTTSVWDAHHVKLMGREFTLGEQPFHVGLHAVRFELQLIRGDDVVESLDLDGRTEEQVIEQWKKWFRNAGYEGEFVVSLHYDLPDSAMYRADQFTKPDNALLEEWMRRRSLANRSLSWLNAHLDLTSEVNIWPHHFDTGTYYELHHVDGEADRSMGAGLAVADTMISESYFYLYAWRKEGTVDYSEAPLLPGGHWITDGWEGAVLPISQIPENADSSVQEFYRAASDFLRTRLRSR